VRQAPATTPTTTLLAVISAVARHPSDRLTMTIPGRLTAGSVTETAAADQSHIMDGTATDVAVTICRIDPPVLSSRRSRRHRNRNRDRHSRDDPASARVGRVRLGRGKHVLRIPAGVSVHATSGSLHKNKEI